MDEKCKHNIIGYCIYCEYDALHAELESAKKDRDRVNERLLNYINQKEKR